MREGAQLSILIVISLSIAFLAIHATNYFEYGGNLTVKNYTAYFSPNGMLKESYEYNVNGHYTMLYRVWNAPLIYKGSLQKPYVKLNDMDCPYYWYVKDYYGKVYTNYYDAGIIEEKAYMNEAGCLNPEGYSKGIHIINYSYEMYPPVQYDKFYHMNIKFAGHHIPYKNFEITIANASNIYKIFPHPPMKVEKIGNEYILKGKSQKNGLLEVELLLKNVSNQKFLYAKNGVEEITIQKNNAYYSHYKIAEYLTTIMKYLLFAFPAIMLLIYYLHGREKKFFVPEYLSFVPKKRKPWLVNLVFKGDAALFDKDGLYATLMDLHRRGIIEINVSEKNLRIKVLKKDGLDEYEGKVISFLEKHARDGVFECK